VFRDRRDAGRQLAQRLSALRAEHPVVIALPRGGVPVAAEIAAALDAPLDVAVVRKLGAPQQPEFGIGAIAEDGVRVVHEDVVRAIGIGAAELERVVERERGELERRIRLYRGAGAPVDVAGRTAILVDDGLATGSTAQAAARLLRARGAARVVLAVPVGAPDGIELLRRDVDEVVCLLAPESLVAIGYWYEDFAPTSDAEVAALLVQARARGAERAGSGRASPETSGVAIATADGHELAGELVLPEAAIGLVLFAHGSGSSRRSPRNRQVADALVAGGVATLLFDLLTDAEAADRANVFDIPLLGRRLVDATRWARGRPELDGLALGYFGASTGAAAALLAAADLGEAIAAVVSRGGRPDLAAPRLAEVRAPTLLIVGGEDREVLALNRAAAAELRCEHELAVVPGATHLFEEPGTLEAVSELARRWFTRHLSGAGAPAERTARIADRTPQT